ncbi:MAG: hypothetical protein HY942_07295 [Gammaproteobacteria bacterium]|nr:hypothetical protein [Gammaproteobacteria bacterium]
MAPDRLLKSIFQQPVRPFSIRTKLLLIALALLLFPWLGYRYVRETKDFVRAGQEQALLLTARAVATVLHDRPELFVRDDAAPAAIGAERHLYAYPLPQPIRVDGDPDDWGTELERLARRPADARYEFAAYDDPDSLSFQYLLGYRGNNLYLLLQVKDEAHLMLDPRARRLDAGDHLRLIVRNPDSRIDRYLLTATAPGPLAVYAVGPDWQSPLDSERVSAIGGAWRITADGYTAELRIPRYLITPPARLAFAVVDVDDPATRAIAHVVESAPGTEDEAPARVQLHSPELARILKGIARPAARTWIIDRAGRVHGVAGSLLVATPGADNPAGELRDFSDDVTQRTDPFLAAVLGGQPRAERRAALDAHGEILMAAHPVWSGEEILGAVLVEQASDAVLADQNRALENVMRAILIAFALLTVALLAFALRLTQRIRRLRDAAERAIGPDGRVRVEHIAPEAAARDELGDLSRSLSGTLGRLGQHTRYLESMPDTLAHELGNPLNVVNSSLDNLQNLGASTDAGTYIARAKNGVNRLRAILTSLTEAATLEEALRNQERTRFDLNDVVAGAVEGYRLAHPQTPFQLELPAAPLPVDGAPDTIVQALDKLVDNALDFGYPGAPIVVRLARDGGQAALSVANAGPLLPEKMRDRLFDPMVSVGKKKASQSRLGLGLYVVRLIAEYHGGASNAENRADASGVEVTMRLPLVE